MGYRGEVRDTPHTTPKTPNKALKVKNRDRLADNYGGRRQLRRQTDLADQGIGRIRKAVCPLGRYHRRERQRGGSGRLSKKGRCRKSGSRQDVERAAALGRLVHQIRSKCCGAPERAE